MKRRTSSRFQTFAELIEATTHFAKPDGLRGTRAYTPAGVGESEPATVPARSSK